MNTDIMRAIVACYDGEGGHGGFVSHMVAGEYGQAAFNADNYNAANFCELVKFTEWMKAYGVVWAMHQIEEIDKARMLSS